MCAKGPLCSVCSEGYSFRQYTQQCEPCSESAGLDAVTILLLVVVGIVIVIAVYLYFSPRFREKVKTLDDFYILLFSTLGLMNGGALRSVETATHIRRSIQVRVKLYITLWQVASLLPFTLGLSFPDTYEIIAAFLNIFNLGVNISSLVTCSTEASFDAIDNLVFTTTYPVAVVALLWVLRSFHLWVQREKDADVLAQISSRYFNVFLIFIYLILPFVSVIIFQTFSCKDVDPDDVEESSNRYMTEDYSVSCTSQKYRFGLIWAIASIFVYPVGVPLYYYYVLHSARQDIKSLSERSSTIDLQALSIRLKPIQMLFEFYEPKLWYWEVVETVHRLLLTGVLVVIAKGSGTQIIVGAVIALSFVKVCEIFRPYMDPSVQTLREVCQWQIFIIFFCALILKADFSSVDSFAIGILLVIAVIANVIFDLGRMLWGRWFAVSESVGKDVDDEDANNPMARSGSRMDSTVEMSVSSH